MKVENLKIVSYCPRCGCEKVCSNDCILEKSTINNVSISKKGGNETSK